MDCESAEVGKGWSSARTCRLSTVRRACPRLTGADGARCAEPAPSLTGDASTSAWCRRAVSSTPLPKRRADPAGPRPVAASVRDGAHRTLGPRRARCRLDRCPNHPHGEWGRHAYGARPRAGRRRSSLVLPREPHDLACCRTVWPHVCPVLMRSNRWWRTPSRPRAAARRPTLRRCGRAPERCAGSRRVRLVHHVLSDRHRASFQYLARCVAEMGAVRARLDRRERCAPSPPRSSTHCSAPLGFHPHRLNTTNRNRARQHKGA